MEVKNLVVPALCVLATIYFMKGCDCERNHNPYRPYTPPQPQPVYRPAAQEQPVYQEVYVEHPAPTKVIRRRVIRRTYTPVNQYYYEY